MKTVNKIKFLAYYLPQYHPIPENDLWWGKGFTEWTNVTKAKPLFKGHYQPILPADLGFYDLRVPEVQEAQSDMALKYGVDGFIYYQYWFGNGKMLLEKPAEAMLSNSKITIPFCFCWANETWKGIWHGLDNPDVLIEQTYEGETGYKTYFDYLLPFFKDERYIKVDNKPMFHIYRVDDIPDLNLFTKTFNDLAVENGFDAIYFVATICSNKKIIYKNEAFFGIVGTDVFMKMRYNDAFYFHNLKSLLKIEKRVKSRLTKYKLLQKKSVTKIVDYKKAVDVLIQPFEDHKHIACVFPNWDNSARCGKKSMIFLNANPVSWGKYLRKIISELYKNSQNPQIIVIKSWNEWAEGNHLEPDVQYGEQWLEEVQKAKKYGNEC